ncbi:VanZ family protein [Microcella daejeonensis]|uniref:VanZ family protein n=1 Tax=Microcella daejeonensis TaxID=2994971 RepID=UPI0022701B56|nr:VanZ family protein [Microcella daejeonensis]WAB84244.1 VanZ family protein [Microcella daejeonensis]
MGNWTDPAYIAALAGTLLFALLFAPIIAVQNRRFGGLSARRLLGAAAVSVYGVALIAYTLLPLPSGDFAEWCIEFGISEPQWRPLQSIDDIVRLTEGLPLLTAVREPVVLQVVLNILLFVPWGVLVRRYLGRGVLVATATAFVASVLIEVTQGTGVFGLIGCAYRVSDVDDLITNTLGGLLGALVAPVLLRWMPQPEDLARRRDQARPVTAVRRWSAMLIDAAAFMAVGSVLVLASRVIRAALELPLPDETDGLEWVLGSAIPWALVLVLPALLGSGASLGQRTVWLSPRWPAGGRTSEHDSVARRRGAPRLRAILRAALGGAGWGSLSALGGLPPSIESLSPLSSTAGALAGLVVIVSVVAVPLTAHRRGLSLAVTGGELVDVRATPTPTTASTMAEARP